MGNAEVAKVVSVELVTSTALIELEEMLTGPIGEVAEEGLVLLDVGGTIVDTLLNVMGVVSSVVEVDELVEEAVVADEEADVDRDWLLPPDTEVEEALLEYATPPEIELKEAVTEEDVLQVAPGDELEVLIGPAVVELLAELDAVAEPKVVEFA